MKFYKLWTFENGAKKDDLTQYLTLPIYDEDRLDETLNTASIALKRVPIALLAPHKPKTKFVLEIYEDANFQQLYKTLDFICNNDDGEQYVGLPPICTKRIELVEPSAIAQAMQVDDIALTYELRDVTLNYRTTQTYDRAASVIVRQMDNIPAIARENFIFTQQSAVFNILTPNPDWS